MPQLHSPQMHQCPINHSIWLQEKCIGQVCFSTLTLLVVDDITDHLYFLGFNNIFKFKIEIVSLSIYFTITLI